MTRVDPTKQYVDELKAKLDVIGTVKSSTVSTVTSLATNTSKSMCSVKIPSGTWLLIGSIIYATKSSGARGLWIGDTSVNADVGWPSYDCVSVAPSSTNTTRVQAVRVVSPSSETTYYANAFQSSGASLNVNASSLTAIRIA